jgi:hypothetical protein
MAASFLWTESHAVVVAAPRLDLANARTLRRMVWLFVRVPPSHARHVIGACGGRFLHELPVPSFWWLRKESACRPTPCRARIRILVNHGPFGQINNVDPLRFIKNIALHFGIQRFV